MATTFDGADIIQALITKIQAALDDKLNDINIYIGSDGISIGDVKYTHEKIAEDEVMDIWDDINYVYDPSNGSPIVLYNSERDKKVVVECPNYNLTDYPANIYTPIGIVVIPKTHMRVITGENTHIMMSLKHMNYDNPNTGGAEQSMNWGGYDVDISGLFNYTKRPEITNIESEEEPTQTTNQVYIPSCRYSSTNPESCACPGTYYFSNSITDKCPSPFLIKNGIYEPNPAYYEKWSETDPMVTSDFNGKENTMEICSKISIDNWQTIENITNSYDIGNYPPAALCWRYSTPGTSQGDWYLPSTGEFGYIMPFFSKHRLAINTINDVYGADTAIPPHNAFAYWTSSERTPTMVYRIHTYMGGLEAVSKSNSNYAVAFCKVG